MNSHHLPFNFYPFNRPSNDIINHKFIKEQGSMLNSPFLYRDTQHLICKYFILFVGGSQNLKFNEI